MKALSADDVVKPEYVLIWKTAIFKKNEFPGHASRTVEDPI